MSKTMGNLYGRFSLEVERIDLAKWVI